MVNRKYSRTITVTTSFLIALILVAMPLPSWLVYWRPAWLFMVLVYWCMAMPERYSISTAWCIGLIADIQSGALLGQHALAFSIIAYIVAVSYRQLRNFSVVQQAIFIGFYLILCKGIILIVSSFNDSIYNSWLYWAPVITSTLIWPGVYLVLRNARRKILM